MQKKSIYKFAAEAGLPVGVYLSLMSIGMMAGLKFDFLNMLVLVLFLAFPLFLGAQMRRLLNRMPHFATFSTLWLFGIYSVIFGTIICMLVTYLYLMFVDPQFIRESLDLALTTFRQLPDAEAQHMADMVQEAIEKKVYPTQTQYVTSMAWMTCFSGSMLSLILSATTIWRIRRKRVTMFR